MEEQAGRQWTGTNTADVRAYVAEHPGHQPGESWFMTRNQSAPTGGQAWRYVKDGREWPDAVTGAVYDPESGTWLPVKPGDHVVRTPAGYTVEQEGPPCR